MDYLMVKNWKRFQHYKERNPTWIKLHASILVDYEFRSLSVPVQLQLIYIWILAGKISNKIPDDPDYISQQIGLRRINLEILKSKGFIVPYDASASGMLAGLPRGENNPASALLAPRARSRETETETETDIIPLPLKRGTPAKPADTDFEEFWKAYPKKVGKPAALKAWKKLKPRPDLGVVLTAIESQKQSEQWQEKRFIPHASTWLNQGRWTDELELVDDDPYHYSNEKWDKRRSEIQQEETQ